MNHTTVNTLTINGQRLHGDAIVNYCVNSEQNYIQQLGLFVKEWLKDDRLIELKTSGSTGEPKSILVEKTQMLSSAAMTAGYFGFQKGQTALLCLPVHYIAGKMMVIRAMLSGLNLLCVPPSGDPLSTLPPDTVIDFAPLLPMQLNAAATTSSIKKILLGGAPVDPLLEQQLQLFPSEIFHGYGMTETLSHVALRHVNGPQHSDVYEALNGIDFETDERDCLVINASFLNVPVYTNDVVDLYSSTSFSWKGRADFVVNSGGVKLYPEEIERRVAEYIPFRFFFAGVPDERFGEKLCLVMEGTPLAVEEMNYLRDILRNHLDKYESPREFIFVPEFRMTTSGKINRLATMQGITED